MSGTFKVQSEKLRSQAKEWLDRKADVDKVKGDISTTIGQGDRFGFMAGANGVKEYYNTWSAAMDKALADASATFNYLSAALDSTANAYDGADDTAVTDAQKLKDMIPDD